MFDQEWKQKGLKAHGQVNRESEGQNNLFLLQGVCNKIQPIFSCRKLTFPNLWLAFVSQSISNVLDVL